MLKKLLRITSVIKEYDYEIKNVIWLKLETGKERKIEYSSDNLVGFSFSDITSAFKLFNGLLDSINIFAIESPIKLISNKQALLVNKKISSILYIDLDNGKQVSLDISTLFEEYEKDLDFYVSINDMVLNILDSIRRLMYE